MKINIRITGKVTATMNRYLRPASSLLEQSLDLFGLVPSVMRIGKGEHLVASRRKLRERMLLLFPGAVVPRMDGHFICPHE